MNGLRRKGLIASGLMVLMLSPAFAASEHHTEFYDAEHAVVEHNIEHAEANAGLPQFDPSSYPSQVFWLAVFFAILYIFFSKKTLPEISSVIENRNQRIDSDIETAEKLREEAEEVQKFYEESLEQARTEASAFYTQAEEDLKKKSAKTQKDFREKATKEITAMEETLKQAKMKAMEEMNSVAAEIATQAAEKIVGIKTDAKQAHAIVDSLRKTTNKKAA